MQKLPTVRKFHRIPSNEPAGCLPAWRPTWMSRRATRISARKQIDLFGCDLGGPNHPAPLLGLVGDEFGERGGCHRHRVNAQAGEPRTYVGISGDGVDLLVEPVDDLGRR